jgi:hypothetical protein
MSVSFEDPSILNGQYEVEIMIDRPVEQVWKQYIDQKSWVTSHGIETVSGKPGTLGAVMKASFKGAPGFAMPLPHHHYVQFIKIVPEQQFLCKTYSEKGGSYGYESMKAFDDARVYAIGDRTRVTFDLFIEYKSAEIAKLTAAEKLDEWRMKVSQEGMLKNLENLKRIVEGQPRRK